MVEIIKRIREAARIAPTGVIFSRDFAAASMQPKPFRESVLSTVQSTDARNGHDNHQARPNQTKDVWRNGKLSIC